MLIGVDIADIMVQGQTNQSKSQTRKQVDLHFT